MSSYNWPAQGGSSGGVTTYTNLAAFPSSASKGSLGVALDTGDLYEWNGTAWELLANYGAAQSLGNLDAQAGTSQGASLTGGVLSMQSASATEPGLVNTGAQTLSGVKTFSSAPNLSSLTPSTALVLDASDNVASSVTTSTELGYVHGVTSSIQSQLNGKQPTLTTGNLSTSSANVSISGGTGAVIGSGATLTVSEGNLSESTSSVLTITGGSSAVLGSGTTIQVKQATTSQAGYLSSTDWNTFNNKQSAGSYITALTGDVTASGPGSAASTLATVNSNVGTFGSGNTANSITVNAKGLITAASVSTPSPTPTASVLAAWDANKNLSANNSIEGFQSIATSNGTTTLTVSSPYETYFTGTNLQSVIMPIVTTLANGQQYLIVNTSTQLVSVASSGSVLIQSMAANTQLLLTCINTAGGTGTASWSWVYGQINSTLPLNNPMTTLGDSIYGAASGVPTRIAGNTTTTVNFLAQTGTGSASAAPVWTAFTAPTVTKLLSTGTTTGYLFTISSSATCAVGDTYTNNGNTYTVLGALSAQTGQVLFMSGAGTPTSGTSSLSRATGSGSSAITYTANTPLATYTTPTSPRSPVYLKIRGVGGGGGGGSSGTGNQTASAGTSTFFGANLLICPGGNGGSNTGGPGAITTGTINSPATGISFPGGPGGPFTTQAGANAGGGSGGAGAIFGGGGPSSGTGNTAGGSGQANTGSGGAGASASASGYTGSGGNGGGGVEAFISSPAATYVYAIGSGGPGASGAASGGSGGSGVIIVEEHYQ